VRRPLLAGLAVALLLAPTGTAAAEPGPPAPPPVGGPVPSGERPGPAPGLRAPARCPAPAAGPAAPDGPTAADRLQLAAVHELATGAGVLVAVIDTGVAPHPRLAGRLRGGGDHLTGGDGLDDCDGHGTAVAGLLAAAPSDGDEVVGMAPGAELLAIRQSSPSHAVPSPDGGLRPPGDVASLARAVVRAVEAGADVVNVSGAVCLSPERAARDGAGLQAALRRATDADVVVVAAAGNTGVGRCAEPDGSGAWTGQVALPGWYDDVVAVGAAGPDDRPAPFTVPGPWVDLAAPGTDLRSLAVGGGVTAEPVAGTSFSAPWVAGLAALLRERFPDLSAAEVVARMTATARRPAGGTDPALGAGVIDPLAALTADLPAAPASGDPHPGLPGTRPAPPPAPVPPVDAALGGMLVAAAGAVLALRRRPGRR
jgi:membrane-anchored mycosin MYCP